MSQRTLYSPSGSGVVGPPLRGLQSGAHLSDSPGFITGPSLAVGLDPQGACAGRGPCVRPAFSRWLDRVPAAVGQGGGMGDGDYEVLSLDELVYSSQPPTGGGLVCGHRPHPGCTQARHPFHPHLTGEATEAPRGRAGARGSRSKDHPGVWSFFLSFYFFILRWGGREGERKEEIHQSVVASHTPPTGDLDRNPGVYPD